MARSDMRPETNAGTRFRNFNPEYIFSGIVSVSLAKTDVNIEKIIKTDADTASLFHLFFMI